MFYNCEKKVFNFLKNNEHLRRYNFFGSGDYFDFIFLCGKKLSTNDNRSFIKKELEKNHKFSLFSEYLYEEFKDTKLDLLTIEDILLSVCAATILIVESFGSACELGAFSFVKDNINKIWVIYDKYFEGDHSFIEDGPILKIKSSKPRHVIYENFRNGLIDYSIGSYKLFAEVGREGGFKSNYLHFDLKSGVCEIRDLGFVLCLIFDYIRLFGFIIKDHIVDVLKKLYVKNRVCSFTIKLPSSEIISDDSLVKSILEKLLIILEKAKVVSENQKDDMSYYVLNYKTMKDIGKKPIDFASFIFKTSFLSNKMIKELSRLTNAEIKEGFEIW